MDGVSHSIGFWTIISACLQRAACPFDLPVKKPVQTLHKIYPGAVLIFRISLS